MDIEIWSDIACPWCYIGKRRLEAALERVAEPKSFDVVWRAFELDPGAPRIAGPTPYADRLARKYGTSRAGAQQMLDSITAAAAAEGLDFHFERAVAANTFEAHQVIHLAAARGLQDQVKERLLRGYFTEGEPVGDRESLARLAAEAGLDAGEVAAALEEQTYAGEVRADEEEAGRLGISGVPFFVLDRKYGVAGAQPPEQLRAALERVWEDAHPRLTVLTPDADAAGEACGPDGCAI